jgi:NIPSNAP
MLPIPAVPAGNMQSEYLERKRSMIVEERCYTLKPGTVALYYQDYNPRGLRIQMRILGNLIGYFHTDLDQIVHLWAYDSLADRERRRARLAADPEWQDYLKQSPDIIVRMETRILIPAPFSPIK